MPKNGLHQGCYFAPHIFTVFLMMLIAEMKVGIPEDCGIVSKAELMGSIIPGLHGANLCAALQRRLRSSYPLARQPADDVWRIGVMSSIFDHECVCGYIWYGYFSAQNISSCL
jgi:hypothetical protein